MLNFSRQYKKNFGFIHPELEKLFHIKLHVVRTGRAILPAPTQNSQTWVEKD